MLSPVDILPWLEANVNGVHRSRLKTLAAIVPAAMELEGVGVLALGRAMAGPVSGKHNNKRVNRFLGNEDFNPRFYPKPPLRVQYPPANPVPAEE